MTLDDRVLRLIAVGASVAANCRPCLQINATEASRSGANEREIAEAIRVGRMIRRGAARKLDEFACELNYTLNALAPSTTEE